MKMLNDKKILLSYRPMFTSEIYQRLRKAQSDHLGIVYHGNHFLYFVPARTASSRQSGFLIAETENPGVIFPIIEIQYKYIPRIV